MIKTTETETLRIAYREDGPSTGWSVILSHGFPYDVHAFDGDAERLARGGARVLRPFTRGFGPTRFRSATTMRSGQQAARALDILQFAEALELKRPILAGFDWGGNASCVVAALWPERIAGLVSYAGYDVINVAEQRRPVPPSPERVCWYQHLFQGERGRAGLAASRRDLCRLLWREWSPGWASSDSSFMTGGEVFADGGFAQV